MINYFNIPVEFMQYCLIITLILKGYFLRCNTIYLMIVQHETLIYIYIYIYIYICLYVHMYNLCLMTTYQCGICEKISDDGKDKESLFL